MLQEFQAAADDIAAAYEQREFAKAMREIMKLADRANGIYCGERNRGSLPKKKAKKQPFINVCSMGIHLFRLLMIYLTPVVPALAKDHKAS